MRDQADARQWTYMYWSDVCCRRAQEWLLLATCLTYHLVLACDSGWFGSQCQFRCHCAAALCNSQGECVNGQCAPGYFGPACQYTDLLYRLRTGNTSQYMYDQNKDTCNEDDMASEVSIELQKAFRFSWMRIVARVLVQRINFQLLLDETEEVCKYKRDFYVDNITVDVTCDSTPLVTQLLIRGDIANDICSVYISGGRDVALKQQANQSRTQGNFIANNAVDGRMEGPAALSFCSSTGPGTSGEWVVKFSRPQLLFSVVVYESVNPLYRLNNVDLFTFNEARRRVNTLLNLTCVNRVCDANFDSSEPSIAVAISASLGLALCEVQVFGETVCPDGTYGLECDRPCSCKPAQICSVVTGTCSEGCRGYYGYECDKPCGVSCVDALCWHRSGDCLDCRSGYYGRLCADVCPDGKYGKKCVYECSPKCLDQKCNRVNGFCLKCSAGKTGPFCQVLDETDYGMWPYVMVVAGGILLSLCCMCLRRARLQQTADSGHHLPAERSAEGDIPEPKEDFKETRTLRSETSV